MTTGEYEDCFTSYYYWKPDESFKNRVGRFQLYCSRNDRIVLWRFDICRIYQKNGYSHKMLKEAIELAKKKSDKPLVLYVYADNEIAINIYKKAGFEITGAYNAPYGDAWEMTYMPNQVAA